MSTLTYDWKINLEDKEIEDIKERIKTKSLKQLTMKSSTSQLPKELEVQTY